jgi:hypothetical protein
VVFIIHLVTYYQSQKQAAERNREIRDDWLRRLSGWEAAQLVFLDESAANERTMDRKYGWSPIGTPCTISRPAKRSE